MAQMMTQACCNDGACSYNRKQKLPSLPRTASSHSFRLQARRLQKTIPDLSQAGHLQCQATAARPGPTNDKLPASPDISLLNPELQQQWHVDKNLQLGSIRVKPQSSIKAVWQCSKCPAGQPHIWTAVVQTRTRGSQCPYCTNKRVCLHNSLATTASDVAQSWNYSKNEQVPEQVMAGSNFRAEWKCPACSEEWQALVVSRTRRKTGCPKCSRNKMQSQPTFAEAQPAELAEWDHERNDAEDIYPENTTLGSNKLVQWICSCCPRGQPHRWTAMPNSRMSQGAGCAVCAGKQACVCNSLASLSPDLAVEFDVAKNGFAPSEIIARSHTEVWWTTAKRGSWKQTPHHQQTRRNLLSPSRPVPEQDRAAADSSVL